VPDDAPSFFERAVYWPTCFKCRKRVDQITANYDHEHGVLRLEAECHGERDTEVVSIPKGATPTILLRWQMNEGFAFTWISPSYRGAFLND
jgi:hypothetical protein